MFEKFKNEDTDLEIPAVKSFGANIPVSKPDPKPQEEKKFVGRRMITSEDQDEVKKKFSKMIEQDPETAISCVSCDINTYYSIASKFPSLKSEIRWQNSKLDYK